MSTSTAPLSFQSSGPNNAPTIVFLHGGGAGRWMWEPVIQLLPEYHCIAPDQPETGCSREIKPFSMALAAEKTAELIHAQAHGGKAVVVGLSEGAQVAVQLLATAPEVVEKAIITSALLRPIAGLGWLNSPALLGWMYRVSIPPFRNADWWIRLNMKYAAGVPNEYFPEFKKTFQTITETEFVNMLIANQIFRLPAGLNKAAASTLVLAGKKEYSGMKQSVRDLAAALPNARGGWINLAGTSTLASQHNWALTAPDLFAATVRAWIEDKPLPAVIVDLKG
jgi:pimeloyl-ACP methyl ester carboxylesterase